MMDTPYFRAAVNDCAGFEFPPLPPEVRSVATWCTGSVVSEGNNLVADENGEESLVPSLVCVADIGLQEGHEANECDELERCLQHGGVLTANGCEAFGVQHLDLTWAEVDPLHWAHQLEDPLVNVVDIANYYDTSPVELAKALEGSLGRTVEVVTDSQFAAVTFSWVQDGRKVVVAIDESGAISRTVLITRTSIG